MIGWLDCSSGASGDMLLGALVDAGVEPMTLQEAVDAVTPEPLRLTISRVQRAGIAATKVDVEGAESRTLRNLTDIRRLLESADTLDAAVRERALATFERLAVAEARVHGTTVDEVHFHEVGALDAIADVVGACAGLAALGLDELVVSPVAVGGGSVRAAHGRLPVPGPAVVQLLAGAPTYGGPVDVELTTPTGAALLAEHATSWGRQPPITVTAQGFGAGTRDVPEHPNVLRLVLGTPLSRDLAELARPAGQLLQDHDGQAWMVETNVDDLDPRLWPPVLADLLAAGASDAWLTPILMKKGRPAHTLHALVAAEHRDAVERVIFTQTSSIGLRRLAVGKRALDRRVVAVQVDGEPVRVKLALLDGQVVNAQPEYEDVVAAARSLGRPAKAVLGQAVAATQAHLEPNRLAGAEGE